MNEMSISVVANARMGFFLIKYIPKLVIISAQLKQLPS